VSIPHHPVRRVSGAAPRNRPLATFRQRRGPSSYIKVAALIRRPLNTQGEHHAFHDDHVSERLRKCKVTDGPFTEAKEVVGGYWIIQVKSREEALEWASRIPGSDNEMVEVRKLLEITDFPADVQEKFKKFEQQIAEGG
jgi:hypothetical protein